MFRYPTDGQEDLPDDASERHREELWIAGATLRNGLFFVDVWLAQQLDGVKGLCARLVADATTGEDRPLEVYGIGRNAAQAMENVSLMAAQKRASLRTQYTSRKALLESQEYARQRSSQAAVPDGPAESALEHWTVGAE